MKKISVVIPCYNEEENVGPITKAVSEVFQNQLPGYTGITGKSVFVSVFFIIFCFHWFFLSY